MPWRGATPPIAGLIAAPIAAQQVNAFSVANILTEMTFRLTDAPGTGDSVTVRLQDAEDGLGDTESLTLSNLETFKQSTGLSMSVGTLWLEVTAASGAGMNLSGEYVMNSVVGVTDPFTTLANVKLDANIGGTDANRDTVINSIIAGVTRQMQDWMMRDIVQGTATAEKLDGWYSDEVYTKHYPLLAITSLTEDGTALVEDTDFESLEDDKPSGRIVRISGTETAQWTKGRRKVKTTYDHGFVTIPDSLVVAATSLVVAKYFETVQSEKGWRGVLSKGVDPNASVTYDKAIWERETVPAMLPFLRRVA